MHIIKHLACIMVCTTFIIQAMEEKESNWEIIEKRAPGIIQHNPAHTTETFADGKIIDRQRHGGIYNETTIFSDGSINCFEQDRDASWLGYAEISRTWHAQPTLLIQDDPNFIRLDDIPELQQFAQQLPAATIVGYYIKNHFRDDRIIDQTKTKTIIFPTNQSIEEYENKNRTIYAPYTETSRRTQERFKRYMQITRITDHIHESIVVEANWEHSPCYLSLYEIKGMQERYK